MNYPADQGGHFESDVHRRVLGHLSTPTDGYGWSAAALFERMGVDEGTRARQDEDGKAAPLLNSVDELNDVLDDLRVKEYAESITVGDGSVWRMTQEGYDLLTGGIADEPGPLAAGQKAQPATIGAAASIGSGSGAGAGLTASELEQEVPDDVEVSSEDVQSASSVLGTTGEEG